MKYDLKVIINGVEILEDRTGGGGYVSPFITNVILDNNASLGAMDIGATASDKLTFTMLNPYKDSFDGDKVEFYILENGDEVNTTIAEIIERVGDDTASVNIDIEENYTDITEDEETGEDLTAEELADVGETEAINDADLFVQLEGESDDTVADETIDTGWEPMGVYYVMGQTTNADGSVTITALDGFCKMNGYYMPANPSGTVQELYNDLVTATFNDCGIIIDPFEFDDVHNINTSLNFMTTYRAALGYFAGLVGGYAEFDANGSVGISFYSFSSNDLIKSELLAYIEDSAGEMVLQEITCNTAINDNVEIVAGAGQGVSFANPLVTETILNDILATYNGMRFVGGSFSALWTKQLIAGNFVRIFTEDEYANYIELLNQIEIETDESALLELKANANTLGSIMLICSQRIDFRGDATTRAISGNSTEASKVNAITPPMIQRVIEAGKTASNYLTQDETGALVVANMNDANNVRLHSEGVEIRNGENVKASFGENTAFYGDNATLSLDSNGVSLRGENDELIFDARKTTNDSQGTETLAVTIAPNSSKTILFSNAYKSLDYMDIDIYATSTSAIDYMDIATSDSYFDTYASYTEIVDGNGNVVGVTIQNKGVKFPDFPTKTGKVSSTFNMKAVYVKGTLADKVGVSIYGDLSVTGIVDIIAEDFRDKVGNLETGYGNGTRFMKLGNLIFINYQGASKTHSSGDLLFDLPAKYRPPRQVLAPFVKNSNAHGFLQIGADGNCTVSNISSTTATGRIYFVMVYAID